MLTSPQEAALALLRKSASFAVIGVSAKPEKYGHEVFETLLSGGYSVYPINPKYSEIDGHVCYRSPPALPAMPDAVVLALAPSVTEQTFPKVITAGARLM